MRPKLSGRKNEKGEFAYSYLCAMKERSQGSLCHAQNLNGNKLDCEIIEKLKTLNEDAVVLMKLIEKGETKPVSYTHLQKYLEKNYGAGSQ